MPAQPGRKREEQFEPRVRLTTGELVKLVRQRQQSGVGIKEMARRLGLSVTAFDNYESGVRRPPERVLAAWREVFSNWRA